MIKKFCFVIILFAVVLYIPGAILAEEGHGHHKNHHAAEIPKLSMPLKEALKEEMIAIQGGMTDILSAMASGNWDEITKKAEQIEGSYIMKKKLTKEQMSELHHSFPHSFHELDFAFHKTAGRLAKAAREHDAQAAAFYFYKLNEGCVNCHSKFATKRFPGLNKTGMMKHENHQGKH